MPHPKCLKNSDHPKFPKPTEEQKEKASFWFETLRTRACLEFEAIEEELAVLHQDMAPGKFERKSWERPGGGGGTMAVMRGRVFEKIGINVSVVQGNFDESLRGRIPGTEESLEFWASGVSFVAHPYSPLMPTAHMNTRMIVTSKGWFGGGGDLTPFYPTELDTQFFHQGLKEACDLHDPTYYPAFKEWCDTYFFLPHRNEPRGVGGVFYDDLNSGDWDKDFAFTQDVGSSFFKTYQSIIRKYMDHPWTEEQRQHQLMRRGRYVEFNLLHDRGTHFGLQTNGNTEAILMSMPPMVAWP